VTAVASGGLGVQPGAWGAASVGGGGGAAGVSAAKAHDLLHFAPHRSVEAGVQEMKALYESGRIKDWKSPRFNNAHFHSSSQNADGFWTAKIPDRKDDNNNAGNDDLQASIQRHNKSRFKNLIYKNKLLQPQR